MLALESSGLNSFSKIEVCVVVGYGPNEGDGEEGDRFWNDMDRTLYNVRNRYRLCIVGRLNVWIGDRTIAGITGAFGVPGENDDGRRVVEFCAERVERIKAEKLREQQYREEYARTLENGYSDVKDMWEQGFMV